MPQSTKVNIDQDNTLKNIMNNSKSKEIKTEKTKAPPFVKQKIKKHTLEDLLKPKTKAEARVMKNTSSYNGEKNKLNEKENLIMKILNYQTSNRFGAAIKKELKFNYTRDQLAKKKIEEIDNVLFRIKSFLNNRNMAGIYEQMVKTTAIGYENIVSEFYDIKGFSNLLIQNPMFWDTFEMWRCERSMPNIPPSMQLLYIISSTTLVAHMQNTELKETQKINDKNNADK